VWRTSLLTSMRGSGLSISAYLTGMILFDLAVSVSIGFFVVGVAVGANFVGFKDAPVGPLLAMVITSAYSINSFGYLLVRLFGKWARAASLCAAMLVVAAPTTAAIVQSIRFSGQSAWPDGLSVIPFFAQVRAIYVLLVFGEASRTVSVALALQFAVGTGCLALWYTLDAEVNWARLATATIAAAGLVKSGDTSGAVELVLADRVDEEAALVERRDDVVAEADAAAAADASATPVVIRNLWVVYRSRSAPPFTAVRDLSLHMRYGEVVGLLGPNGAGKSTTIGALTGVLAPTHGQIFVAGQDVAVSKESMHANMGITTQDDVVWEFLSVSEHLTYMARAKGFRGAAVRAEAQRVAVDVGLDGDAFNTRADSLSGGMRRRLSIGMALVGDPAIVVLDEPTTGLDVDTRQQIWAILQKVAKPNRLVLLTTHSMVEAEALCTRIAIVVKGELKCVGSSLDLKARFGSGLSLAVNMAEPISQDSRLALQAAAAAAASGVGSPDAPGTDGPRPGGGAGPVVVQAATVRGQPEKEPPRGTAPEDELHDFVSQLSDGQAQLVSARAKSIKYSVPTGAVSISKVFKEMENNKARLGVREWALAQSTLEDVFIRVARD